MQCNDVPIIIQDQISLELTPDTPVSIPIKRNRAAERSPHRVFGTPTVTNCQPTSRPETPEIWPFRQPRQLNAKHSM